MHLFGFIYLPYFIILDFFAFISNSMVVFVNIKRTNSFHSVTLLIFLIFSKYMQIVLLMVHSFIPFENIFLFLQSI